MPTATPPTRATRPSVRSARASRSPAILPPDRYEKWVVLGCVHVPAHDPVLWPKVLRFVRDHKPDGIVLAGDFLDLVSLSSHIKGKLRHLRHVKLTDEYEAGRKALDQLESALPAGAKRKYLYGNHEDRYERFLEDGDNDKIDGALESPTEALRLRERGYEVKDKWKEDYFKLGAHFEVLHGTYFNKHAAMTHMDKLQSSVMFAHTHRVQSHVVGKRGGYNIGTLGQIWNPAFGYMDRAQRLEWSNGFGLVGIDPDGHFHAQVIQAYGGKFAAGGRLY